MSKTILYGLLIVGVFALGWLAAGNGFFMYKVFAPAQEQVRRTTFEESKAYNQGTIQNLESMRLQYMQAADSSKAAIATIILHRAADYPMENMEKYNSDLAHFIKLLRTQYDGY